MRRYVEAPRCFCAGKIAACDFFAVVIVGPICYIHMGIVWRSRWANAYRWFCFRDGAGWDKRRAAQKNANSPVYAARRLSGNRLLMGCDIFSPTLLEADQDEV